MKARFLFSVKSTAMFVKRVRGVFALAIVLLAVLGAVTPADAGHYELEIVAKDGMVIDGYTILNITREGDDPQVNDLGEVVFTGIVSSDDYTGFAVMTNRRMIARVGDMVGGQIIDGLPDQDIVPRINNDGDIAYTAIVDGVYSLLTYDGSDNSMIAQSGGLIDGRRIFDPWIPNAIQLDNSGNVWFSAPTVDLPNGLTLFTQNGVVLEPGDEIDGEAIASIGSVIVTSNGQVGASASLMNPGLTPRGTSAGSVALTVNNILLRSGSELDDGLFIDGVGAVSYVHPDGRFVVGGATWSASGPGFGLAGQMFLLPDGPRGDGDPRIFQSDFATMLDGNFAYVTSTGSGVTRQTHIMVGDEVVLSTFDIVDGEAIRGFGSRATNLNGDVVMNTRLMGEGAGRAIVLARAVPEPASIICALFGIAMLLVWLSQRRDRPRTDGSRIKSTFSVGRTSARPFGWHGIEQLEPRQMLAGFDLADYVPFVLPEFPFLGPFDNISGAAYVPGSDPERFYTVRNGPERIYEFYLNENAQPTLRRPITLTGFDDTEGIVYLDSGVGGERFAIVEEKIGEISILTISPGSVPLTLNKGNDATVIVPNPNPIDDGNTEPNDGLEGIAYRPAVDPANDLFYVAKEINENMGVYQVEMDRTTTLIDIRDSGGTPLNTILGDSGISDIYFADISGTPTIFVLSEADDEPKVVRRVELSEDGGTITGTIVETLDLNILAPNTNFPNPEGIAFNPTGSDLFITSEPNLFYQFRLGGDANRDGAVDRTDLAAMSGGYGKLTGAVWSEGDFTGAADRSGDGAVNLNDLAQLRRAFGTGGSQQAMGGGGSGGAGLLPGGGVRTGVIGTGGVSVVGGGGTTQAASSGGPTITVTAEYVESYDPANGYSLVTVDITDPSTNDPGYLHRIEFRMQLDSLASDEDFAAMSFDVDLDSGLSEDGLGLGWSAENGVFNPDPNNPFSSPVPFWTRNSDVGVDTSDWQAILVEAQASVADNRQYGETPRPESGEIDTLGYPTLFGTVYVKWDGSATQLDLAPIAGEAWATYTGNGSGSGAFTSQALGFIGATMLFGGGQAAASLVVAAAVFETSEPIQIVAEDEARMLTSRRTVREAAATDRAVRELAGESRGREARPMLRSRRTHRQVRDELFSAGSA